MARITYIPNRIIDADGISDGANIYVYETGTTTPVTLYLDDDYGTPASNPYPVAAGAAVPPLFYNSAAQVRVKIVDSSGATVSDDDPYNIFNSGDVSFTQSGTGAVTSTVQTKLRAFVSVLDFIPTTLHAAILAGTSTTNVASYVQAAIDYLNTLGGGELGVPVGRYYCTTEINLCAKLTIQGCGRASSRFYFTSTHGFRSTWTLNGSTGVHIYIRDIGIEAPTSNTGIGLWEQAGTFLQIYNCRFLGFKWHIAFDQTELAEIELCDFEHNNVSTAAGVAAVWLVSGADLAVGSLSQFTNRISISRCQFNSASTTADAIRDDGGTDHWFANNNYNGFRTHVWAAGVTGLNLIAGEYESSGSHNIYLSNLSPTGGAQGSCVTTNIVGASIIATTGNYPIYGASASTVALSANYFSGGNSNGAFIMVSVNRVYENGNLHGSSYPVLFGSATNQVDLSTNAVRATGGLLSYGGGVGYTTGAGGTVTQATSKATGVTLNKTTGTITMNAAALAATTSVGFTLTNSLIAATDVVLVSIKSGATADSYTVTVDAVAAGSCRISLRNVTAGSLSEAVVLSFAVIKGVAA